MVMNKVLTDELAPKSAVAAVPEEIDEIVLKPMSKDKNDRYESVLYLRDALESLYETQ